MSDNLLVGGFPYETTEEELPVLFRTCGTLLHVKILMEPEAGRGTGPGGMSDVSAV